VGSLCKKKEFTSTNITEIVVESAGIDQ